METENKQVQTFQQNQHSIKLIGILAKLEIDKTSAKIELVDIIADLMPKGKANFLNIIRYPTIEAMRVEHGKAVMIKALFLMVKDFCNSLNVVRNMNEDQMIETAAMLLDECGNFRMEDYLMMFQMAKKGELWKIYDRIDIQVVTAMLDAYWLKRKRAAEGIHEIQIHHLDNLGPTAKAIESLHPQDARLIESTEKLSAALSSWKDVVHSHAAPEELDLERIKEKYS